MQTFRKKLARPALHVLVAALVFGALQAPILINHGPSSTWLRVYGAWAATLVVLVVLSLADDREGD